MRFLVALSVLGCALAAPFLQDTPEVVAERARFQQLWNAQAAAAAAAPDIATHSQSVIPTFSHQPTFHTIANTGKWTGPVAATIPAGVPGSSSQVQDTADVMNARNAFLQAFKAQVAATTGHHSVAPQTFAAPQQTFVSSGAHHNAIPAATLKWTGPVAATVPAGVNGHIIPVGNTAEVDAATRDFEAAYNAALARNQPATQTFAVRNAAPVFHAAPAVQARWTGPVAATIPAGLPGAGSQVGQTADWAAATAAFQQAYNQALTATTGRRF